MSELIGFRQPATMIIQGATGSGKTTFIMKLIDNIWMMQPSPIKIHFFFETWQKGYETKNKSIQFHKEELTEEKFKKLSYPLKEKGGSLFVLDDGMTNINKDMVRIFSIWARQYNASIILVTHNLFYNDPIYRNLSLNTHYFVLLRTQRAWKQVSLLLRQLFSNYKTVEQFVEEIFSKKHAYVILDVHPDGSDKFKALTRIFPNEWPIDCLYKED